MVTQPNRSASLLLSKPLKRLRFKGKGRRRRLDRLLLIPNIVVSCESLKALVILVSVSFVLLFFDTNYLWEPESMIPPNCQKLTSNAIRYRPLNSYRLQLNCVGPRILLLRNKVCMLMFVRIIYTCCCLTLFFFHSFSY